MTQTMQQPDETTVEATRRREVTYWVDERNGLFPLPWWKLLPLVALIGAAAVAIMTLIMIPIYERQVINNAKAELSAAGIDPSGFNFDASYRDLDISGTLPEGVSVDDIRAAAELGDGQRDLDLDFAPTPAPVVEEEPEVVEEPVEEPEVAVATAPTNANFTITDAGITLTGEVPSEQNRALLVGAAESLGLPVTDELVVLDLAPTVPGSRGRVLQLANLISALPPDTEGSATLTDSSLTSDWVVTSETNGSALQAAVDAAGAVDADGVSSTITVDAPPVAEEIGNLQEEFSELAIEIRENVTFVTGSDVLNDTATETLDKVVDLMTRYEQPVVEISGHTDDIGNDAANLALSELRAAAVGQYLIDAGISADRIQSVGRGETEPIADNDSDEGRAENRRVELVALETFVS